MERIGEAGLLGAVVVGRVRDGELHSSRWFGFNPADIVRGLEGLCSASTSKLMKKIKKTIDPLTDFLALPVLFLSLVRASVPRFATAKRLGEFTTMANGILDRRPFCFFIDANCGLIHGDRLLQAVYLEFGTQCSSVSVSWHSRRAPDGGGVWHWSR